MFVAPIIEHAIVTTTASLTTTSGILALASGAVAAALIVAGSFVKTMVPLRWLAVGSNLGFIACGALYPSLPMLALHALLLPINIYRAAEMVRLTRRVNAAAAARDVSGLWLRPYMKRRRLGAGEVLFRKGDQADHLYMLTEGRIELVEIGIVLTPGRVFGEIAFFAPDRRRTQTARCLEPCRLLSINESAVRQLYYQNPEFGFELIGLVAGRLAADIERLQQASAAMPVLSAAEAGDAADKAAMSTPLHDRSDGPERAAGAARA